MKNYSDFEFEKDKNLREAVMLFEKDWISKYPDELELAGKFSYSIKHRKRMNRLLKNHDTLFFRATSTPKKQIAAAIITLLIGFNTLMITNVEARAIVVNFIIEIYESFSDVIFPNEEAPNEIIDIYQPSYLPSDYKIDFIHTGTVEYWVDYKNSNEEVISFTQATLNDASIAMDTEGSEIETLPINNTEGIIVFNKDYYSLHWSSGEYRFNLLGNNKKEIIKMAESLEKVK